MIDLCGIYHLEVMWIAHQREYRAVGTNLFKSFCIVERENKGARERGSTV